MDGYNNLSRESLIHEIRQLNKTIDALSFKTAKMALDDEAYLNAVKFPVFLISPEYDLTWANTYATNAYDRLYQQKCYQAIFGFGDICVNCPLKEVLDYKTTLSTHVHDKEGSVWQNQLMPIFKAGRIEGILEFQMPQSSHVQITDDFKETISVLRQENTDLKKKLNHKNDFMKIFARKLLTPLKALKGVYTSLEQTYLSQVQAEYLEILNKNSTLLFAIFNRALIQADTEDVISTNPKREFDLPKLLMTFRKFSTELSMTLDDNIPKIVFGDETNFTMALYLLLESSIAISSSQKLYANVTHISETQTLANLKITIADRSDELQTSFKNFSSMVQDDPDLFASLESYNANMGLQVGKRLIEGIGGTVIITRTEGKGVHITLFVSFEKVKPHVIGDTVVPISEKQRILFVDEERPPISLEMFDNYDIYFANSHEQAISLFKTYAPKVTLINIVLTNEDGFRIFDALEKQRNEGQYIFSTSHKLIENERDFMKDYGFDDYFPKPLKQEALRELLKVYTSKP